MKNKSALQATVLAFGQVFSKILSLIFLFMFSKEIGKNGMSIYAYSFIPFSIFSDLSSFGFIPATSKLCSKLKSDNEELKISYLYRKGLMMASVVGLFFFVFMVIFSSQIIQISLFDGIEYQTFKVVRYNLLIASISLFIIPINNFLRGFLQGHLKMYATAISLILENFSKIIIYYFFFRNINNEFNISYIFIIYFLSHLVSLSILVVSSKPLIFKEYKRFPASRMLIKLCLPIGVTTLFFTFYQFIDTITLSIMLPIEGYYTAFMFENVRLIFFPIVIAQALAGTINPRMNYLYNENKKEEVNDLAIKTTNFIINLLLPLTMIMKIFSNEIYDIFYNQENGGLILNQISILIIYFGLYKVLLGLSLNLKRSYYLTTSTLISGIAKTILNILLINKFGYLGAMYSTIIAVSICLGTAYYVLYKENIKLFFNNIISIIKTIIISLIGTVIISYLNIFYSLDNYPSYISIILNSILLLGICYIFNKSINIMNELSIE